MILLSGCLTTKPKVVTRIIYKDRVIYKSSCPSVRFPRYPTLNVFKVEYNNTIYYCLDEVSARALAEYLLQVRDIERTLRLVVNQTDQKY